MAGFILLRMSIDLHPLRLILWCGRLKITRLRENFYIKNVKESFVGWSKVWHMSLQVCAILILLTGFIKTSLGPTKIFNRLLYFFHPNYFLHAIIFYQNTLCSNYGSQTVFWLMKSEPCKNWRQAYDYVDAWSEFLKIMFGI